MARLNINEYDYLCKVILIGDSGCGKTSVLGRFTDDVFTESFVATIGVDFKIKTLKLEDGKVMKLQVWDTSGQERFRSITQSYYRGAHAAVLVYDLSSRETFNTLPDWIECVKKHCSEKVLIMLLGNKLDLASKRTMSKNDVEEFAREKDIPLFFEVSAKTGRNIDEAFLTLAETYKSAITEHLEHQKQKLEIAANGSSLTLPKSTKSCC